MKLKSHIKITAICTTSIIIILAISGFGNAETQTIFQPDAQIDINGGLGIKIFMEDIRENASTNLSVEIWTNFSFLIRPIFLPKSANNIHFFEDISPGGWGSYLRISPYRIGIGRCFIEVTVGNVYKSVTGRVFGQYFILE